MKRSIAIQLIHANEHVRDAACNALRPKTHASVWPGEYDVFRGRTVEGYFTLTASIHFYDATERDNAKGELKAVNGIIRTCEEGSKITRLICYHDELGENGSPVQPDVIEDVETP